MLLNYFKTAWRSMRKSKLHSLINITGLSVGMAIVILIGLWIMDELNHDKYHSNYSTVGQVLTNQERNGEKSTMVAIAVPIANELRTKYGEDFKAVALTSWKFDNLLSAGDKKFTKFGMWVEAPFPQMFGIKMLQGNPGALNHPKAIFLSESLAKALFGSADPMNRDIRMNNEFDVQVAGIYQDLPRSSSFYGTEYLASWKGYEITQPWVKRVAAEWDNHSFQCFVQLHNADAYASINNKIRGMLDPYFKSIEWKEHVSILPMRDWYLRGEFKNGVQTGGRIRFVWLFGIIGGFVLLLACINFMNLGTARSEKRAREVGIRKTVGSIRKQLIFQFLSESLLTATLSLLVAILLVTVCMPLFNEIAAKEMSIPWTSIVFWASCVGFTFFTGLLAGSYPAFYLSSFQPIKVLKGTFRAGRYAALPRKMLVVLQFTVSIVLIIGTIVVFRQVQHARNRPVGYNSEGMLQVQMTTPELKGHYDALRDDLLKTGVVADMAESSSPLTSIWSSQSGYSWAGKDPAIVPVIGTVAVTHDYGNTAQWQLLEGRDFSRDFADSSSFVLNEAAVKLMGLKKPIGEIVKWDDRSYQVIGVVKNMLMTNPYQPAEPTVYMVDYNWAQVILIRIKENTGISTAIAALEQVFKKHDPASTFEYKFVDEIHGKKFAAEERVGKLAGIFATLAIFISCLGIFGLASFVAEQRIKEIGVRKILGASVFSIWQLLSKDFCWLVLLSFLLSAPVAWYFMNNWLNDYGYRTEIAWWIFALAFAGAMLITLATVSVQVIKAAVTNPVRTLKSE
jgi:putative ABC transport system permease protein